MKKIIVGFVVVGIITLSGCGKKEEVTDKTVQNDIKVETAQETDDDTVSVEALADISVEKNLFSVEFTVPRDFVGEDVTQESLNEKIGEGIKSVTLNADGSVTYVMTKEAHKEMMDEMTENLDMSLNEMVGSEDYPTYTKIEHNSDFTQITVYIDAEELGLMDSISVLGMYMYGGMYNAFNGTSIDNINVKFISNNTGEIVADCNSSEMGED